MIIECPLDVDESLHDGGSHVFIAANGKEGGLSMKTLQSETLVTEEVRTAVLRLAKRSGNVLSKVGGAVADGDWDIPNGGRQPNLTYNLGS